MWVLTVTWNVQNGSGSGRIWTVYGPCAPRECDRWLLTVTQVLYDAITIPKPPNAPLARLIHGQKVVFRDRIGLHVAIEMRRAHLACAVAFGWYAIGRRDGRAIVELARKLS
jgi:hypothetical protein